MGGGLLAHGQSPYSQCTAFMSPFLLGVGRRDKIILCRAGWLQTSAPHVSASGALELQVWTAHSALPSPPLFFPLPALLPFCHAGHIMPLFSLQLSHPTFPVPSATRPQFGSVDYWTPPEAVLFAQPSEREACKRGSFSLGLAFSQRPLFCLAFTQYPEAKVNLLPRKLLGHLGVIWRLSRGHLKVSFYSLVCVVTPGISI